MDQLLARYWPHVIAVSAALSVIFSSVASVHAVLWKRDPRSSIAWAGYVWVLPFVGPLAYVLFGMNRISRRGARRRAGVERLMPPATAKNVDLEHALPEGAKHLSLLARMVDGITRRPLTTGNRIVPLHCGDEAYPQMLESISSARRSVCLASYIFADDEIGRAFCRELGAAAARGVAVRVLIDAIGSSLLYSVRRRLRSLGVPSAQFMKPHVPLITRYANLRNHRKILVVDGTIGFTGGMNIHDGNVLESNPSFPVRDLHFRVEVPVVRHISATFAEDWSFCTDEKLAGDAWFPDLGDCGDVVARGIAQGPDEDHQKLRWAILGAIALAKSSVRIVTPYFIPEQWLIVALNVAAMRGVAVDIVVPAVTDLRAVRWASTALLWQVLEHGCRVYESPGPFDHTKLMVVDEAWSLMGSANMDPRSLRLNFEFNVECYDPAVGKELDRVARERIAAARQITLADVQSRGFLARLRDGVARLFAPLL
jgi:cardiolipin synthase